MESQRSLIIIKPDAVRRGLIGEIVKHYEMKGLNIVQMKMLTATDALLSRHYAEHITKPFYKTLIEFMKSGPMVAMIVEGPNAVEIARKINGETNHLSAEYGSIRGLYANSITENCVHGSDSVESAKGECGIWFE